jgi:tetratricopeptide (TPR) repeat protein
MSYRIRVPAKTLQVDEAHLISGVEHTLIRLQEYRRPLLVGLGVFLLAAAVVGGVFWIDRQASQKAFELEREATRMVMLRPTNDPPKADKALKDAIAQYRQVIDQYPRTPSASLALYHLGNALVQANDLPGAIDAYQRFTVLYGSQQSLVALAQQRLAYVYLLKGDRDQAAKVFSSILTMPGALNKDQALYELARLEESQSRPEGAVAHYQELLKSYPRSPYASEATLRTKILDTKSVPDQKSATPPPSAAAPPPSAPSASSAPAKK